MAFDENKHPRDSDGKFTDGNGGEVDSLPSAHKVAATIPKKAWGRTSTRTNGRIKVGEITSPIYDDMVLSNGRSVKDIVTRVVEIPLRGSAGAEHIESHPERKGMVAHYIGMMNDIINDPDYGLKIRYVKIRY